jgi:AcrR family transcriptional regulator
MPSETRIRTRTRTPGRRSGAPLSRERILLAALEMTEADGLAALSTRRLGERLGCKAMSIYHHFPGKHHLLDAMVDHVIAAFEWPAAGPAPLERLRRALHAYRRMAMRWPALYPLVATHRLNTPTGVAFIEGMLALVQDVVPDAERAARHFRAIGYYMMGAGLDETAGYAKGPTAAEPVDDAYVARHCPRLAASARWFARSEWDATFTLGVEAMLAAVARDAAA